MSIQTIKNQFTFSRENKVFTLLRKFKLSKNLIRFWYYDSFINSITIAIATINSIHDK